MERGGGDDLRSEESSRVEGSRRLVPLSSRAEPVSRLDESLRVMERKKLLRSGSR
jgi:hypothetical protein